jgi:hypothetical protein
VAYTNPVPVNLVVVRRESTLQVGSDFIGPAASFPLEANYLAGLGQPLVQYHGSNVEAEQPARVSFRGNVMTGNEGEFPLNPEGNVSPERFYGLALANAATDYRPVISTNSTTTSLVLTIPPRNVANVVEPISVEIYLADPVGLSLAPAPSVQSLVFVAHLELDGAFDGGDLTLDISTNNVSANDLKRLTVSASYKLIAAAATETAGAMPAAYVTTPFAATLGGFAPPVSPIIVSVARQVGAVGLSWTGGAAPYKVQAQPGIGSPWADLLTTSATTATVPATNSATLLRVVGN